MEKFVAFINKYGIVVHLLSMLFWVWLISLNYEKMQLGNTNLPTKISYYFGIVLLLLSTFNLINAIRKFKNKR
jgi:hypothetical protein